MQKKKELRQYVISQIRRYRNQELVSILLTVCYSISVIATPYLTRYLVDSFSIEKHFTSVWKIMTVFLFACFMQPIFSYFSTKILQKISENVIFNTRSKLFWKVIHAPMTFFHKNTSGAIVSRLTNDGRQLGDLFLSLISNVFQNILFIILIMIGMFLLSPIITVALLVLVIIYVAFNLSFNYKFEKNSSQILKSKDEFYRSVEQGIRDIEDIKTAVLEDEISDKFDIISRMLRDNTLKLYRLYNIVNSLNTTIEIISVSIIYCIGFWLISKQVLTVGAVVAFDVYFQMMMPAIRQLLFINSNYHVIMPALQRLNEYFSLPVEHNLESCNLMAEKPKICLQNVFFSYSPHNDFILQDVSFDLESPGLYGLIGTSGSGKSTIAKLILGLYQPDSGKVLVDVGQQQIENLRKKIAYISQDMLFFNETIYYNLTLGNECITKHDVFFICKKLKLHNKFSKLPNGYEELITEKINLSGGELQRLNLARVFLQKKPINIMDEITSALDSENVRLAKAVIEELAQTSLVLLITHEEYLLENAKRIYCVENKKIKILNT